jgi:hypothetical protein
LNGRKLNPLSSLTSAGFENALTEPVETAAPVSRIMAARIHMPNVLNRIGLEKRVLVLTDFGQSILVTARNPEKLKFSLVSSALGMSSFAGFVLGAAE